MRAAGFTVSEIERRPEPVCPDPFIADLAGGAGAHQLICRSGRAAGVAGAEQIARSLYQGAECALYEAS